MRKGSILYLLLITLFLQAAGFNSFAAERCESLFLFGPYQEVTLNLAISKATANTKKPGLSPTDLQLLVEHVFEKQEGRRHKVSDYWNKSASERSLKAIERELSESLTKEGLINYFQKHNLLLENSKLKSKIIAINRSRSFNILTGLWSAVAAVKGAPPVFLPDGAFKISTKDLNTLLLKGTESIEGRQILKQSQWRLETNRGYELFSRYYSRVALAALFYIVYDKASDYLDKNPSMEPEEAFDLILANIEEKLPSTLKTKEDILFDTVLENFKKKYSRSPNAQELGLICEKVYGPQGC